MPTIALRSVLVAIPLILGACPPKPGPPATSVSQASVTTTPTTPAATPASPAATCLLGDFQIQIQQRMTQDNGVTALLEDQRIGATAVLFTAQRDAIANARPGPDPFSRPSVPQPPQTLLVARGTMVTQELDDLSYVDNNGAKPTATETRRQQYTYFLADAAWDCSGISASVRELKLPSEPSPAACLSDRISGCQPVTFGA